MMAQAIPEINALTGSDYIFQQDGAPAHTSAHMEDYLKQNLPATASYLRKEDWPQPRPQPVGLWCMAIVAAAIVPGQDP